MPAVLAHGKVDTRALQRKIILPQLLDGPRTCDEMDVPRFAAQHLKARKLVACRMRALYGANGRRLGAVEEYMLPEHVPPKLIDCATLDFAAIGIG